MELSRYSEILKGEDGYVYLFNTYSKKWLQLDADLAALLSRHINNLEIFKDLHSQFYEVLTKEHFVVENANEDTKEVQRSLLEEYESLENVKITINPTLDCNVRCWYCYEDRFEKSIMSDEIIQATNNLLNALISTRKVRRLELSFFGGEPLLHYDKVVSNILKYIIPKCKEFDIFITLQFTSNGLLLSSRIIESLKGFDVPVNFQIAFDGNREFHNEVKFLSNGYSCYDTTIKNVKNAIEAGFGVVVRCNYNKKTVLSFVEVIKDLAMYHQNDNLTFSFQRIWQETEDNEMKKLKEELTEKLLSNYCFNSNLKDLGTHSLSRCYADFQHNYLINYDGKVGRCTARNFTEEYCIGHLQADGLKLKNIESGFEATSYNEQCVECKLLTICPICSQCRREQGLNGCDIPTRPQQVLNTIINVFEFLSGKIISSEQKKVIKL